MEKFELPYSQAVKLSRPRRLTTKQHHPLISRSAMYFDHQDIYLFA